MGLIFTSDNEVQRLADRFTPDDSGIDLSRLDDAFQRAKFKEGENAREEVPDGYYDTAPYGCAPTGYYGPEWFNGDGFIGAGPWFHGPHGFYGHVNHAYDPHFGYHGPYPNRGDAFHEPTDHWQGFHATHSRDGQGHERGR